MHIFPNQISLPHRPFISFSRRCILSNISVPTIYISSMISNVRFSNLDLKVLSFSNVSGVPFAWLPVVLNSNAECIVIPSTLNAATHVGAVTSTVTSVGLNGFDNVTSLLISCGINFITWLLPTPPGPLRKMRYGGICLFSFQAWIAFLHHLLLYIMICLCFLFKPRVISWYLDDVVCDLLTSRSTRDNKPMFTWACEPRIIISFASKSAFAIGRSMTIPSAWFIISWWTISGATLSQACWGGPCYFCYIFKFRCHFR